MVLNISACKGKREIVHSNTILHFFVIIGCTGCCMFYLCDITANKGYSINVQFDYFA